MQRTQTHTSMAAIMRGGQDEFPAVANPATLAVLRVEVVATEDWEHQPCVTATF